MQRQFGWLFITLLAALTSVLRMAGNYPLQASTPLTSLDLAPLQNIKQIAAGGYHTCALTTDGGVKCWGYNYSGQLGNNSTKLSPIPVDVTGLNNGVTAISTGDDHTCALTAAGGVKCWGDNYYGQLGNATNASSSIPADVSGLSSGVSAINAAGGHTCALTTAGGVKCWGDNYYGQLGNNSTARSNVPVDVVGLSGGISAISGQGSLGDSESSDHICVLTTAGGVKCWGYNLFGQLGNNSTTHSSVPVDVIGLSNDISALSVGNSHTCAVTIVGGVKCWGGNADGQLGNNSTISSSVPIDVSGLSADISVVSAGDRHTCALTTTSGVKCWGYNHRGQLGIDSTSNSSVPIDVSSLSSGISAISAGDYHTCALTTAGGVKCWGDNYYGQLGNNSTGNSSVPVDVSGLSSAVSAISAGGSHTCVLTTSSGVKCWGNNFDGQLGNSSTADSSVPVDVSGLSSGVSAISAGGSHTCTLTTANGVRCWGNNHYGQLGNNSTTNSDIPVDVSSLSSGVSAISASGYHTCALTTGGGVKCWGDNSSGQLGNNSTTNSNVPVNVSGLSSGVSAISPGAFHTCVLTTVSGVKCWGDNFYGQLGNNSTSDKKTPVDVSGLSSGVSAISSDGVHTCALMTTGGVKCWGDNNKVPIDVFTGGVNAISTGNRHNCVLMTTGGVKCWGDNGYGQLGDKSTVNSSVPVDVSGLTSGVSAISVGGNSNFGGGHTCALTAVGGVKCWGANTYGQLGDGNAWRTAPVDVFDSAAPMPTNTATPTVTPCPTDTVAIEGGCIPVTPTSTFTPTPTATPTTTEPATTAAPPTATNTATPTPTATRNGGGDEYEADDQCATAKTIASDGVWQSHTFHIAGNEDWVQFAASGGAHYRIEVQIPPGSQADVTLEVYPACADAASHTFDATFTPGVRLDVAPPTSGSLWLRLRQQGNAAEGANFAYQLLVRNLEQADKRGALILVAGRLKLVDKLQSNIHKVTQDVFKLFQDHG